MLEARRRRLMEKRAAGKVGRRYFAFYRGCHAKRTGRPGNPYKPGTEEHKNWQGGWQFAESEELDRGPSGI